MMIVFAEGFNDEMVVPSLHAGSSFSGSVDVDGTIFRIFLFTKSQ